MTVSWPAPADPRDAFTDAAPPHPFAAAFGEAWRGLRPLASLVDETRALSANPGR